MTDNRPPDQGITCKHGLPHGHPCSQCGAEAIAARTSNPKLRARAVVGETELHDWEERCLLERAPACKRVYLANEVDREIERLTRERDAWRGHYQDLLDDAGSVREEMLRRDGERDRLRARCDELERANVGLATESERLRAKLGRIAAGGSAAELAWIAKQALLTGGEQSPSETDGWQPIETAPKDGRTLLLGYFNSHGKWRSLHGQWFEQDSMDEWNGDDYGNPAGWYEISVENDDPPNCWATEPTHWQPTPRPPSKAKPDSTGE